MWDIQLYKIYLNFIQIYFGGKESHAFILQALKVIWKCFKRCVFFLWREYIILFILISGIS